MPGLPIPPETYPELSRLFRFHAGIYAGKTLANASPLYAFLSARVAEDPEVLALVEHADRATQIPNLLFGAVHDLLLRGVQDPLSGYYPDLTGAPLPLEEAYPAFLRFCLSHAEAIRDLVTTRRVQTNEVQRCACLLPAFGIVAQHGQGRALALVEIGASAGLNLLWDSYSYAYGAAGSAGRPGSPVRLACAPLGKLPPPIPAQMPPVASRVGIDLHPIRLFDEDRIRWLRALIWPEHTDRAERLKEAVALARQDPPAVIEGSAVDLFSAAAEDAPADATLCVYHSFTLNQMARPVHDAMLAQFEEVSRRRPFYRVALEWYAGQEQPRLTLFAPGSPNEGRVLALCESHGREIEWLAEG
jgi:hypothetical protein